MTSPVRLPDARLYRSYQDLAEAQRIGIDYTISIRDHSESSVAIVAPHAGKIESYTSEVASAIAGDEWGLYLLEGIRNEFNFETLHLSSHYFDEPRCLDFIRRKKTVITVHGCNGKTPVVYLGGLDHSLKQTLADALVNDGFEVFTKDHKYKGEHPNNICNKGFTGKGVQIELTDVIRHTQLKDKFAQSVRTCLVNLD